MITFLTVVHVATVILLVITVLLQSGKGADISASFGGSSQTVFGSSGGVNFFQKLTYGLAAVFMMTSLTLTLLPGRLKKSVFEGYTAPPATTAPVSNSGAPTTAPNTAAAKNPSAPATKAAAPANDAAAPAAPTKK
jgi:preprotein translocase subunit SecG